MPNQAMENLQRLQQQMISMQRGGGPDESGLISGPIMQRRRLKREAAQAEQVIAAESVVNEEIASDVLDASGLQINDATQRSALFDLAANPDTRQLATGMLGSLRQAGAAQNAAQLEFAKAQAIEEGKLRRAYHTAIRPVVEVLTSVDVARQQLKYSTPEAAFNGARLFIQQLDKSMITNPELANLLAQQGAAGQLDNLVNWIEGGGKFDDDTRQRMVDSMAAIGQVFKAHGDGIMQQTRELASRNPLQINPENVTTMAGFANREWDMSISNTTYTPPPAAGTPVSGEQIETQDGLVRLIE